MTGSVIGNRGSLPSNRQPADLAHHGRQHSPRPPVMPDDGLRIKSGALIAHRLLDVAFAIDLKGAESMWLSREGRQSRRTNLATASANELAFEVPPALLVLGPVTIEVTGEPACLPKRQQPRLYDFGVIAMALRVEVGDMPWSGFFDRFNALDRAVEFRTRAPMCGERLLAGVLEAIGPALRRPPPSTWRRTTCSRSSTASTAR